MEDTLIKNKFLLNFNDLLSSKVVLSEFFLPFLSKKYEIIIYISEANINKQKQFL